MRTTLLDVLRPRWKLNFNVLVFALVGLLFIVLLND